MKTEWILAGIVGLIVYLFVSKTSGKTCISWQCQKNSAGKNTGYETDGCNHPDEPTAGAYYGEIIPVIIAVDSDDHADLVVFDEGLNALLKKFSEISPYKLLQVNMVRTTGRITDYSSFQAGLEVLARDAEVMIQLPENSKILLFIWCPYWLTGAELFSVQKIGKYIYSYCLIRDAYGAHFPEPLIQVGHELSHALGLTGDTIQSQVSPTDVTRMFQETASDYGWTNEDVIWLAEDEKIAISNRLFNDGQAYQTFLFGCRNGIQMPWYHKYINSTTPHEEYSARWDEVVPFIEGINNGTYINKNPC